MSVIDKDRCVERHGHGPVFTTASPSDRVAHCRAEVAKAEAVWTADPSPLNWRSLAALREYLRLAVDAVPLPTTEEGR